MTTWSSGADTPAVVGAGRYRLDLSLDRSALAATWQAWDLLDGRAVIVRVVRMESRLLRERWAEVEEGWRQTLVGLDHPALVPVRNLVADGDQVLLVSDPPPRAASLRALGLAPRPDREAAAMLAPIAAALAYVHRVGLPHLAVAPAWVLVGRDGTTWLDGCGLAPLADAAGQRWGDDRDDAAYRAPEQSAGDLGGPPADVFALGRMVLALAERPGDTADGGGALRRLGAAMAATDPGRRPSAREASERLAALARPDGPSGPTTRRAPPPVAAAPAAEKPPAATTPRAPVRATTGRADRRRGLAQLTTGVGAVLTVVGAVGLGVVVLGGDDPATTGTTTASVPAGAAGTAAPDGSTAVATTVPDEPPAETAPATPEVLPLVSGPSAVCPYAMPQGWSVVAVDRPTGGQLRTVTRSPDGAASITCDATVPSGAEARATAAAARRARGPLQAFEEERFGPRDGAGSAWVWEYRHRQAGRPVRVLRVFLSGGDALGLEAAETAFEGLRPTFTAVVTRYEQGA